MWTHAPKSYKTLDWTHNEFLDLYKLTLSPALASPTSTIRPTIHEVPRLKHTHICLLALNFDSLGCIFSRIYTKRVKKLKQNPAQCLFDSIDTPFTELLSVE